MLTAMPRRITSVLLTLILPLLSRVTTQDPSEDNKVMHALLEADNGITFMASDTPNRMEYTAGTNYSMSLSGDNEAELKGYFEKLSAGGNVTMPLEKAPWGDTFGMPTDKFGVSWLVNIAGQKA